MLQAVDRVCSEIETHAGITHALCPMPRDVSLALKLSLTLGLGGPDHFPGGMLFLPFTFLSLGRVSVRGRLTQVDWSHGM